MESPMNHHPNQTGKPDCLDISPERLKTMSPSELEQAMEDALSIMTEEDYDPAVIEAYLNALDNQAPMPMYPDAKTSYTDFQQKVRFLSGNPSVQGMQTCAPPPYTPCRVGCSVDSCLFVWKYGSGTSCRRRRIWDVSPLDRECIQFWPDSIRTWS